MTAKFLNLFKIIGHLANEEASKFRKAERAHDDHHGHDHHGHDHHHHHEETKVEGDLNEEGIDEANITTVMEHCKVSRA
jgi:ABC-type Zn2+ transport system substrate-binding protein/surface adhesin